jgi:hypothetical protein
VNAWAQSLLAGDKIPDLTWTISEETGEIVATVTQRDAIIHEAKMWCEKIFSVVLSMNWEK